MTLENKTNFNISIEKPRPEDFEGIQDVFYRTWIDTYPNDEVGITREAIEEQFKNRLAPERKERFVQNLDKNPNELFIIAKDGDKVVGVCGFVKREEVNQLQRIYVLPEYQGKGIGKKFWAEGLKFFGKGKRIIVQLADYNENAKKFYETLGFKDNGKRFTEERHRVNGISLPEMEMELVL